MGQAWEIEAERSMEHNKSLSIQPSESRERRRGVNYVNKVLLQKYGPEYTYK